MLTRSTLHMSRDAPVLWPNIITVREDSRDVPNHNLTSAPIDLWACRFASPIGWKRRRSGNPPDSGVSRAPGRKARAPPLSPPQARITATHEKVCLFVYFHLSLICTSCLFLFTRQAENEKMHRMEADGNTALNSRFVCWFAWQLWHLTEKIQKLKTRFLLNLTFPLRFISCL